MIHDNFKECSIFSYPHAFVDKRNDPILVKPLSEKRFELLRLMYLNNVPRNIFNGLPPIRDDACIKWTNGMIDSGVNLIAVCFEKGVIGHVALFPMEKNMCEMLVVVSPDFHNRGIGTQLTRCAVQLTYEAGFDKIWLSVETQNRVARHVYTKCGFKYQNNNPIDELDMILDMQQYRRTAEIEISGMINRGVISINGDASCKGAISLFMNYHIGALPVINDEREVVGMLSETDLIMEVNLSQRVSDIMTRQVILVKENYQVAKVIRLFQSKKFRTFPVVDNNRKLIGVIGRKDILGYYYKNL